VAVVVCCQLEYSVKNWAGILVHLTLSCIDCDNYTCS